MNTQLTITGLPLIFSTMISEAAMYLPAMTRPQDNAFLIRMTEILIDAFWQNYVAELPEHAYEELAAALKEESEESSKKWYMTFANFGVDVNAQVRAEKVLDELREKMPTVMQKEYELFTENDAGSL